MTPAEELSAAATWLRETAAKAIPGPWGSLDDGDRVVAWKVGPDGFDDDFDYVVDEPMDHAGNAAWIALAHPGLAEPLAALLESAALLSRTHKTDPAYEAENRFRWCLECNNEECEALQHIDKALAVARAITGSAA